MSLLTRCPACATLYRVVPDQLRISEGWVKCGQCGDIFDASKHLIEAECEPEPAPVSEATQSLAAEAGESPDAAIASAGAYSGDDAEPWPVPESVLDEPVNAPIGAPAEVGSDSGSVLGTETPDTGGLPDETPSVGVKPQPEVFQLRWDDAPAPGEPATAVPNELSTDPVDVSFLTPQAVQGFWQKTWVSVTLWVAVVALGVLLVLQWGFQDRDRLAVQHPELKPVLQALCDVASCQMGALKRIESLSVDSVGFTELGQDRYRLSFSVRNAAGLPLAFPLAQLTLTDGQDNTLYQRVFSADELGTESITIAAGAEWPVGVTLRVGSEPSSARVLGYRLLVFYP
jgi:predicted Zn finger-like uncharacterized protein